MSIFSEKYRPITIEHIKIMRDIKCKNQFPFENSWELLLGTVGIFMMKDGPYWNRWIDPNKWLTGEDKNK